MIKTIVILAMIAVMGYATNAYAYNDFISIVPSRTCETTKCILVKDLMKYDTSDQKISGKFVFDEKKGDYDRQKGMKNSINFYTVLNKLVVFVDPDNDTISRSRLVIIHPTLTEFALDSQKNKKQIDSATDIRYLSVGMFATPHCDAVSIGIKQVNVTTAIQYLLDGCPDGQVPYLKQMITNKTQLKYCGNHCQYEKFMKEAKEKSKSTFLVPKVKKPVEVKNSTKAVSLNE